MPNETQITKSDRIAERIRPEIASETAISKGAMAFQNIEQIMEFGKVMAIASVAIPKHLRDNPGACLAVAIQASEWEMSPFSVANKTYVVNDRLAYEAQLINAVILKRAPIVGRFDVSYAGEGDKRTCTVKARLKPLYQGDTNDRGQVEYTSPEISKIPVKNSPLWKGDPDQQLFYYSSRAMCRRHFPDVILGIYAPDEIEEMKMVEGTTLPYTDTKEPMRLGGDPAPEKHDTPQNGEVHNTPTPRTRKPRAEKQVNKSPDAATVSAPVEVATPQPEPTTDSSPFDSGDASNAPATPLDVLRNMMKTASVDETKFQRFLILSGYIEPSDKLERMPNGKTQEIVDSFSSILPDFLGEQA